MGSSIIEMEMLAVLGHVGRIGRRESRARTLTTDSSRLRPMGPPIPLCSSLSLFTAVHFKSLP